MTIQAQLSPQSRRPSAERRTDGIVPDLGPISDAFALLDHRTRSRAVPCDQAPPGRYLSVEDGDEVRLIPLQRPVVHLGRGLSADVRLEDPHVSRRHAIVAQRGDGARLLDDRSANGTFLNGRLVTVAYLSDGDVLRLGRAVLRFVEVAPAPERAPVRRRTPMPVRAPGAMLGRGAA